MTTKYRSCIISRDPTFIAALKRSMCITLVFDPDDKDLEEKCEGLDIFSVSEGDVPHAARIAGRRLWVQSDRDTQPIVVGQPVNLWGYTLPDVDSMGLADSIDIDVIQHLFLTANGGKP